MANHTLPSPVWLFDLDNTLHDASHAIFPAISANMNTYIGRVLGDGLTPATQAQVDAARLGYWKRYGATLLGMIRHHGVSAADFLHVTHDLGALDKLVRAEKGLGTLLRRLPGRKILLTNAPTRYSTDVMRHLGLSRHFAHHVAIEHMHVHRQLRPKPSSLMLRRLLRKHGVAARRCILVEDTLANLKSASRLGLRTVWVTQYLRMSDPIGKAPLPRTLKRPGYVDVKVKSVRQLPARLHRLR
ncbi:MULTISPECIES: HAD-IA family hydrolase [Massilia]|uniref:HAD-IA family hydrolase n=1 Tax=Massilia TaxID=149698 RepID=UPI0004E46020|nr:MULTISPECIES: HAD-IA family hydrolase [Massilia]KFC62222.1 Pyrimidine 5'-nucleotidase [Massilia sp. LC238]MDK6079119.1 HAD-IA family hydrolase [Massilia varians]